MYELEAKYESAKEVGGDYYDYLTIDKDHLGIVVADVSGKGVPGSLVMTQFRSVIRLISRGNRSAIDILQKTNAILSQEIRRGMFVTVQLLILHIPTGKLIVTSAGHNPLYVIRKNGAFEQYNPTGIAVGFDKGMIFNKMIKEQIVQLQRGDRFVSYTDGLPEAMSPDKEEYGDDRFIDQVKRLSSLTSAEFVQQTWDELQQWQGGNRHDDFTILTVRLK